MPTFLELLRQQGEQEASGADEPRPTFLALARNTLLGAADILGVPESVGTELGAQLVGAKPASLEAVKQAATPAFAGGKPTFLSELLGLESLPAKLAADVLNPVGLLTATPVAKTLGLAARGTGAALRPIAKIPGIKQGVRTLERGFSRVGAIGQEAEDIGKVLELEPDVGRQVRRAVGEEMETLGLRQRAAVAETQRQRIANERTLAGFSPEERALALHRLQRGDETVAIAGETYELAAKEALAQAVAKAGIPLSPGTIRASMRMRNVDERIADFLKGGQDVPASFEAQLVRQADDLRTSRELAEMFLGDARKVDDVLAGVQQILREPARLAPELAQFVSNQRTAIQAAKETGRKAGIFTEAGEIVGVDAAKRMEELGRDVTTTSNILRKEMKLRKIKTVDETYPRGLTAQLEFGAVGEVTHARMMHGARVRGTALEQALRSDIKLFETDAVPAIAGTMAEIYNVTNSTRFLDGVLSAMGKQGLLLARKNAEALGLGDKLIGFSRDQLRHMPKVLVDKYEGAVFPKAAMDIFTRQVRALGTAEDIGGPLAVLSKIFGFARSAQTIWKRFTLGVIPAWLTRNQFGAQFTAVVDGGLFDTPLTVLGIPRYLRGYQKSLAATLWGSTDPDMIKLMDRARKAGIIEAPQFVSREAVELGGEAIADLQARVALARGFTGKFKALGEHVSGKHLVTPMTVFDDASKSSAARRVAQTLNRLPDIGFWANSRLEDAIKLNHFRHLTSQGVSDMDAAKRALAVVFNVDKLANFEKDFVTFALPFYNFTRQAVPLSFKLMRDHPRAFQMLGTFIKDVEKEFEGNVDFSELPIWQQAATPIRLGRTPGGQQRLITLETFLPMTEINRLTRVFDASSLRDMARSALDSVMAQATPLYQLGAVAVQGPQAREHFRQQPMEEPTSPDRSFLGVQARPANFALRMAMQIRALNEIDRANPFGFLGSQEEPGFTGVVRSRRDVEPLGRAVQFATGLDVRAEDIERERRRRAFRAKERQGEIKGAAVANLRRRMKPGDLESEINRATKDALQGRR